MARFGETFRVADRTRFGLPFRGVAPASVAPVISGLTDSASGSVVTASLTTNQTSGTVAWVVTTTSGVNADAAQATAWIKAGLNPIDGSAASGSGTETVTGTTVNLTEVGDALVAGAYFIHVVHTKDGLDSNVLTSDGFTTTLINVIPASFDFSSGWTTFGAPTVTQNQTDRFGGTTAALISVGNADTYRRTLTGLGQDVRHEPSVWIRRDAGTPTGTLRIHNPFHGTSGDWRIPAVDIPTAWTRITRDNLASFNGSIVSEFKGHGTGGDGGISFSRVETSGDLVTVYIDDPQLEAGTVTTTYQRT